MMTVVEGETARVCVTLRTTQENVTAADINVSLRIRDNTGTCLLDSAKSLQVAS